MWNWRAMLLKRISEKYRIILDNFVNILSGIEIKANDVFIGVSKKFLRNIEST